MAWEVGILLSLIFVVGIVLYIINSSEEDNTFTKIINYFFTIITFLTTSLILNMASVIASDNGASSGVTATLNTSYSLSIWIFLIIAVYMAINLIASVIQSKKEMEEEDD